MKVSIVTAVFNCQSTLRDCLQSIHAQTHPDIEHIIIDGGSTDGSLELVNGQLVKAACVISEKDNGIYPALNKGISRCTGEIVGMLHADDYFENPVVVAEVAKLFENPQIDMVYGDLEYVSGKDISKVVRYWKAGLYQVGCMRFGWSPPHTTVFVRRSVFEKFGLYREDMRIAADYDWLLRLIHFGGIQTAYLPRIITRMRMGGTSNKSVANIVTKSWEDLQAWRYNGAPFLGVFAVFCKNVTKLHQLWKRR